MKRSDSPTSAAEENNFTCFLGDNREELTETLRSRLIECGWRDQVANMCRNLIQKHGIEQIRLEQIISEVKPKARQIVPDHVRTELLDMIRKLDQNQLQPQKPQQPPEPQSETVKIIEEDEDEDNSIRVQGESNTSMPLNNSIL